MIKGCGTVAATLNVSASVELGNIQNPTVTMPAAIFVHLRLSIAAMGFLLIDIDQWFPDPTDVLVHSLEPFPQGRAFRGRAGRQLGHATCPRVHIAGSETPVWALERRPNRCLQPAKPDNRHFWDYPTGHAKINTYDRAADMTLDYLRRALHSDLNSRSRMSMVCPCRASCVYQLLPFCRCCRSSRRLSRFTSGRRRAGTATASCRDTNSR